MNAEFKNIDKNAWKMSNKLKYYFESEHFDICISSSPVLSENLLRLEISIHFYT